MKRVLTFYKNRYFYSSLVLGLGSLLVLLLFRYTKGVEVRQVVSQTQIEAKSVAMNLDLIMANYVLKTQNLEDFLEIKKIKSRSNQQVIQTIFENTIFSTFSVLKNNSPQILSPTSSSLNVERLYRIVDPNKKTAPMPYSSQVRSEAARRAISEMVRDGDRQKQFFINHENHIIYVIINRSKEDKNYFYVLTGMAQDLFSEALPKQSSFMIAIGQQLDNTFWLIEKNEKNLLISKVTSFEQSQRFHHFTQETVRLDYESQFSPKDNFNITVYSRISNNVINMDRAILLFFVSATILLISFLIFYLMDRNFHIQQLVYLRTRELEVETERSKQATIAKSRFLASISHEIRTPLNIVLGMTDLLEETKLSSTQNHYLQSIRTSGRHLLSLLNDILDMTRIDLKEVIFKPTHVDALNLISEACLAINEVAANKNLKLYCKISPLVPTKIFIDHARLKQILINLLMNAVKYTERGSVTLDVGVSEVNDGVKHLSITVTDTGIGIASDNLDHIFKSFFQVDQKGSSLSKGVGLGLSIVASIVKRLNGDIHVNSKVGEGSQFVVTLPLRDVQSASWSQEVLDKASSIKSKILFLSPDPKTQEIVKSYDIGFSLGIEFSAQIPSDLRRGQFDFVFLDAMMVSQKTISFLNEYGFKKIFIFDFDPVREKEVFELNDTIEIIPHRLFLPKQIIEILEDNRSSLEENSKAKKTAQNTTSDLPLSVLIVEDDASNRILFQAYLASKTNWVVDYAVNGVSALQDFLDTKKYDVMVTDLQMPEMDGFTLISKIEEHQKPSRIVILSADSTEETAIKAKSLKIDQFITKPVRKMEFIKAIEGQP